ncbi:tRNA (guanosine(37)-N1)-methyltransferase TrmD [Elusimicrobiota bacterium]
MKKAIINILTIFPEQVKAYTEVGILNQALSKDLVEYNIVDIRDFSEDKHRKVDEIPYGGGPGMVMQAPVVVRAIESLNDPGIKILLEPGGEEFTQDSAETLVGSNITLICGRYTGIDFRVRNFVDRIVSVGDFIVSGGELPALIITEAVVRLMPGVLGDQRSIEEDKGYPVYTRPREFRGLKVPEVLFTGNHRKIKEFRDQEAKYGRINK